MCLILQTATDYKYVETFDEQLKFVNIPCNVYTILCNSDSLRNLRNSCVNELNSNKGFVKKILAKHAQNYWRIQHYVPIQEWETKQNFANYVRKRYNVKVRGCAFNKLRIWRNFLFLLDLQVRIEKGVVAVRNFFLLTWNNFSSWLTGERIWDIWSYIHV